MIPPEPDPPEPPVPSGSMIVNLTNTMNQTLYFAIYGNRASAPTPVAIAYNEEHQFIIPNDNSQVLNTKMATSVDGTLNDIRWRGPSYDGYNPSFIADGSATAVYAGNNASTTWTVDE